MDGDGRLQALGRKVGEERELYRTDARADGDEVWIGGWALDHDDTRRRCSGFTLVVSIHHEFDPLWIGLPDMLHGGALVLLPKLDLLG